MQIHRLKLVNFRQHEDTELALGAGLTGIVGPNGAGKTTLLEAIAYAVYGAPAARGTRESIRRRGAPPRSPVRVELDFTLGPHLYKVVRTLTQAELYQDGDPTPVANSITAVTEKVTRLLGMTREEFFNTYFTGQKELAVMAAMSAPERAQFLSRVLGYERLRVAQDRLRERRSALKARLAALEEGLPDPAALDAEEARERERLRLAETAETEAAAAVRSAEARWERLRPRWEELQRLRETVLSLQSDLKLADHKVQDARQRFTELDRRLAEALEARRRLEALAPRLEPHERLRAERQTLDQVAEAHAARRGDEAQLAEVRQRLEQLEQRIAKLPTPDRLERAEAEAAARRETHDAVVAQLDERRTTWVRDAQDAKTKRQTLLDQYKELTEQQERIVAAGQEGACPTCARPLGDDYAVVLEVLDRQLQDVLFNGNYYKQRIEQLKPPPPELAQLEQRRDALEREMAQGTSELGRLTAQLQEAPGLMAERQTLRRRIEELESRLAQSAAAYDRARHEAVRRELAALEPLALEAAGLRAGADRAEPLVQEAEAAEQQLSTREGEAAAMRERLEGLGYREEDFLEGKREVDAIAEERRGAELRLARAQGDKKAAQEAGQRVARLREERAQRQRESADTAARLRMHVELDRALSELRTDLNADLRPELSDLASTLLRDLTYGRYSDLELDEDYVPCILSEGERKPVISGGEEDVANLALRLAISQMIAERAGQPLSLLVLDEIFGSLDEERRGAVLELLRGLADRFPQVILITHIEAVRDGFDRLVRVELDAERQVSIVRDEPMGGRDAAA